MNRSFWIVLACGAIVASLVVFLNPFRGDVIAEADTVEAGLEAAVVGVEEFLGWILLITGSVAAFLGFKMQPMNHVAVAAGVFIALAGVIFLADPAGGRVLLKIVLLLCLLGSGLVKILAGIRVPTGQLKWALFAAGGFTALLAMIFLAHLLETTLVGTATIFALDLLGNGLLAVIWAVRHHPKAKSAKG
ncbi:MAG: hypothetical protein AAGG56_13105 [Pseudomonadota bacterium]